MTDFTVLYPHHPYRRLQARARSIAALDQIETHFGGHVARVICSGEEDYSRAVIAHWNDPGDLIIVEQDMGPTSEMIEDFLACPELACTQPYWLSPASTGFGYPIISVYPTKTGEGPQIRVGDEWAGRSAVGLVRLSARARAGRKAIEPTFYGNVEHHLNEAIGWRWHVHFPMVPHFHGFREEDYERDQRYLSDYYAQRRAAAAVSARPPDADQSGGPGKDARGRRPATLVGT